MSKVLPIIIRADMLAQNETVRRLTYRPEILEVAQEIADGSDVLGLEGDRLDFLLRAVLFLDRRLQINTSAHQPPTPPATDQPQRDQIG